MRVSEWLHVLPAQVSVLDKSKMDWQDFKKTDKEIQEELDAHARSDKQYLDRQVRPCWPAASISGLHLHLQ